MVTSSWLVKTPIAFPFADIPRVRLRHSPCTIRCMKSFRRCGAACCIMIGSISGCGDNEMSVIPLFHSHIIRENANAQIVYFLADRPLRAAHSPAAQPFRLLMASPLVEPVRQSILLANGFQTRDPGKNKSSNGMLSLPL